MAGSEISSSCTFVILSIASHLRLLRSGNDLDKIHNSFANSKTNRYNLSSFPLQIASKH